MLCDSESLAGTLIRSQLGLEGGEVIFFFHENGRGFVLLLYPI